MARQFQVEYKAPGYWFICIPRGAMQARRGGHSRVEALFVAKGAESRQKQDIKAGRRKI